MHQFPSHYQSDPSTTLPPTRRSAEPFQQTAHLLIKVPEITILFWIIKLLTTAMGETTSDFLVRQLNPIIAVALGGIGLLAALIL